MPLIAPSLLSANFLQLGNDCEMLNKSEADWFHIDIMDGHFVPNISFGPMVTEYICKTTAKSKDVHLMISNPDAFIEAFAKAGASSITVHYEGNNNLHRTLQSIQAHGCKAAVAVNPHTKVDLLTDILGMLDMVLVMSVNPGFGGQTFIPHTLKKIETLKNTISKENLPVLIEVDGGITLQNASSVVNAGADVLVAGNTIFKSPNPTETIAALKHTK